MPDEAISGISRRQLADLTGQSREAVRRTVLRLIQRGEVVERDRGVLSQAPGSRQRLSARLPMADFLRPSIPMINELDRFEAITIARGTSG